MNTWFWENVTINGSNLPTSREGHSFIYNSANKTWVLFGGVSTTRSNATLSLDTTTGQWKTLSKTLPPLERSYHVAWLDSKSQILYIFGGQGPKREPMYDMHALIIPNGKWVKLAPTERPPGRIHSAGCIVNSCLYLFAGASAPSDILNNDLWALPYREINWTMAEKEAQCPGWVEVQTISPPLERKGHTMICDKNTIYLFGGVGVAGYLNDLACITPPNFAWFQPHTFGQSPQPRAFHSSTVTSNSKMIIYAGKGAGLDGKTELLKDIYILDLNDLYWSSPFIAGFYPSSRYGAGIAWGKNINNIEQILILGGIGKIYSGMDVYNLQEKEIDSNCLWHLEDVEGGKLKFQASIQSTLLSNRRKIRDLEGQNFMLQEKISFLDDEIFTLKGKTELEKSGHQESHCNFIRISKAVKLGTRQSQMSTVKALRVQALKSKKVKNLVKRVEMLESVLEEIESFLVVLDSTFYDTISMNLSTEFRTFSTDRIEEINERKKCHHEALAYLRGWYELSYDSESSI